MVISEKKKYVYIAIPKTGSQAVCYWLCCHYHGRHALNYHEVQVPEEYGDHLIWTVVRNPYERCFSWWWFGCREPSRREKHPDSWGQSFSEFMGTNLERKNDIRRREDPEKPNFSMSQKQFVKASGATVLVHYESLKIGLSALPFIESLVWPMAVRNPSTKPKLGFHDYFSKDPTAEQIVWDYCSEDFEEFGYERVTL